MDDVTTELQKGSNEFWIKELSNMSEDTERRINQLTKRVQKLERKNYLPSMGGENNMVVYFFVGVVIIKVLEGFIAWKSQSASSR